MAAGQTLTTASYTVAIGENALYAVNAGANVAVGREAGSALVSGTNNILIGTNAQATTTSVSNQITLGDASIATLRCQVTSITALSDARDKKDVVDLPVGLEFINKLRPVKFTWDMRQPAEPQLDADGNPIVVGKIDILDAGFIAQELMEVEDTEGVADWLQLTYRDNPDQLEATQGRLIPILVKAIQELSVENKALAARLTALEN